MPVDECLQEPAWDISPQLRQQHATPLTARCGGHHARLPTIFQP